MVTSRFPELMAECPNLMKMGKIKELGLLYRLIHKCDEMLQEMTASFVIHVEECAEATLTGSSASAEKLSNPLVYANGWLRYLIL